MIGNEPILGDLEILEEMRLSGELEKKLSKIGWKKVKEERKKKKLKMAVVKKKEKGMIEEMRELAGR